MRLKILILKIYINRSIYFVGSKFFDNLKKKIYSLLYLLEHDLIPNFAKVIEIEVN